MTDKTDKNYPNSSSEIARMLNLQTSSAGEDLSDAGSDNDTEQPMVSNDQPMPPVAPAPQNLPIAPPPPPLRRAEIPVAAEPDADFAETQDEEKELKPNKVSGVLKAVAPYAAIFGVGLFLYYFFFSDFSFLNVFKGLPAATVEQASQKQSNLEALEEQDMNNYLAWMKQFYFEINDSSLTDPNKDLSGNGLTNFQKYLLNLNPKAYDSLGLGMPDGQAILNGTNPGTGYPLTDEQKKIVDQYFDTEVIANRISASTLAYGNSFPGSPTASGISGSQSSLFTPPGSTASGNGGFVAGATNYRAPQSGSSRPVITTQSLDQNSLGINTGTPGKLDIPQNGISVPIMWTGDTKDFERDLKSGIVHYPGTPFPGDTGTSYISGHSSNYVWVKSPYNQVFAHLDQVKDGSSFTITVSLKDGSTRKLHYTVRSHKTFKANDQAQFLNSAKSMVALSTCWPVGTTANRYVVYAELTQVER